MPEFAIYDVAKAAEFLKSRRSVLVMCHNNPDGDAIGSSLSLVTILRALGKEARAVCPSEIPEKLEFLAEGEDFSYSDGDEEKYDALVTVDVASRGQLGRLSPLTTKVDLMIDHHAKGEAFAPNLIRPEASAAAEIIFDIYEIYKRTGDIGSLPDAARYIFAAISSDTGSFKYNNATPHTFRVAADLVEEITESDDGGYDASDLSRLLHDTMTEKDQKIANMVADRIKLYEDGALAMCLITADIMASLDADDKDFGGAIDVVRSRKGVIVAVTVRQSVSDSGTFKISARAASDIDVSEVCGKFGGGGHKRAAGATIYAKTPEEAYNAAQDAFSAAVREFKGGKHDE
ncbi:MAG: bifunctional oligoribonuclease/PAP phosphatase NrnA [Clostridia bacterium]|nr:bifunctional oligoribonuclease/PAP phosphatase NrnA [Clostridia bacterium]